MWYNKSAANKKVTIPILANALKKSSIYDILYYEYLCSHINKKYLQIYHEQEVDKMKRQGYNSPRAVPCQHSSVFSACQSLSANSMCEFSGVPRPYYDGRGAPFCVCSVNAEGGTPPWKWLHKSTCRSTLNRDIIDDGDYSFKFLSQAIRWINLKEKTIWKNEF